MQKPTVEISVTPERRRSRQPGAPPLLTWIAIALLRLVLVACASNQPTYKGPLTKPTVDCGEHAPWATQPRYPVAPDVATADELDARHASVADYSAALRAVEGIASDRGEWAIKSAGIDRINHIHRDTTIECHDDLRRRGVLN